MRRRLIVAIFLSAAAIVLVGVGCGGSDDKTDQEKAMRRSRS